MRILLCVPICVIFIFYGAHFFLMAQSHQYLVEAVPTDSEIELVSENIGVDKSVFAVVRPTRGQIAREAVVREMEKFLGSPYGTGPGELVCNIAIFKACENAGFPFHLAVANDLFYSWPRVDDYGQNGDVLFYTHQLNVEVNPRIAHVMLISDHTKHEVLHASSSRGLIRERIKFENKKKYWPKRHRGTSRIPSLPM